MRRTASNHLWTVGHSTRTLEFFTGLLLGYGIECLVDIRTVPKSRFNPQFHGVDLGRNLASVEIDYLHLKDLGGLRRPLPDSPNAGWENKSFRGYADYMGTEAFAKALAQLQDLAQRRAVAIMCAEAVPWRCHRSLVADALTVRGWKVFHIMSRVSAHRHHVTPWAKVEGERIVYGPQKTV
jgi:uncharacterized protein (DUF488 family)